VSLSSLRRRIEELERVQKESIGFAMPDGTVKSFPRLTGLELFGRALEGDEEILHAARCAVGGNGKSRIGELVMVLARGPVETRVEESQCSPRQQ